MASVFSKALDHVFKACIEGEDAGQCAQALLSAADALYSPLKPVDSGLGEARRIASRLSSIIANAVLAAARERGVEDRLHSAYEVLKEKGLDEDYSELVSNILRSAGASVYEPARSREAREAILGDLKEYFEPEEEQFVLRRRRRGTRRQPNPQAALRRLLRELGRYDPLLARHISEELRAKGISV